MGGLYRSKEAAQGLPIDLVGTNLARRYFRQFDQVVLLNLNGVGFYPLKTR